MEDKIKIILDTDIGDDIDDAFSLALIAQLDELDLVGVTTVYRNTVLRAKQALKLLNVMNLNKIKVYAGERDPIKEPIHYFDNDVLQVDGYPIPSQYSDDYSHYKLESKHAVDFIIEKAHELENELVIVCVGPLTNMALALKKDPSIANKIKKVVIMGGSYIVKSKEWNILCDPEAADIVFRSGVNLYCVGLDVTLQCDLDKSLLSDLAKNKDDRSRLLTYWFNKWSQFFNFNKSVMHDPLAVTTLVSDVCTFEQKGVKVNLDSLRGSIDLDDSIDDKLSNIWIATSVNRDKFYQIFKRKLVNEN
ncbi:nucleoside hydrolase [Candidatus Izemoplasma sp. B36]|uniref:nucleoside hydrolase n=1 Tax=Candidatus Izemoplasma sp. B36 TaxID=3242468 RepID=UPI003555F8EB